MPDSNLGKLKAGIDFWLVRFENLCFTKRFDWKIVQNTQRKLSPYCSALDFWKIEFEKSLWTKLIFTACVACKIQVRNRPKFKFVQLDFSNLILQSWFFKLDFSKIKCRSIRVSTRKTQFRSQHNWLQLIWLKKNSSERYFCLFSFHDHSNDRNIYLST